MNNLSSHVTEKWNDFIHFLSLLVFKLDTLKENNLKTVEELNKSKELLSVENQKMEEFKKEMWVCLFWGEFYALKEKQYLKRLENSCLSVT